MTTLGALIKERRKKLNLTQYQLARLMGVTQTVAAQWEYDKHLPREPQKLRDLLFISEEEWRKARTVNDPVIEALNNQSRLSELERDAFITIYLHLLTKEK